jgi:uncharacterized protein with HEPN domain
VSADSIRAKAEFILKMLTNIQTIIVRHNGIVAALSDEIEARPAILMAWLQIGETLNKIDADVLAQFGLETDAKGSYDVRNFIAHDYMGVDLGLVEMITRNHLPVLSEKISRMLSGDDNNG